MNMQKKNFVQRYRFNRYMVECESVHLLSEAKAKGVLIDTWWNVNFTTNNIRSALKPVLIDTWWNVNTEEHPQKAYIQHRFNRYMVECESRYNNFYSRVNKVLIDTWWNVNISIAIVVIWYISVLIDTWWNVNFCIVC